MGANHIDIHKSERQWDYVNLGDIEAVKGLILFRDKLDQFYGLRMLSSDDVKNMNISLILLYAHLDELIKKSKFNEHQLIIINLLYQGYKFYEIDEMFKFDTSSKLEFNYICKEIIYQHDKEFDIWINKHYLLKDWKICRRCNDKLPASNKYFSIDKRNNDGLHSYCKHCRRK